MNIYSFKRKHKILIASVIILVFVVLFLNKESNKKQDVRKPTVTTLKESGITFAEDLEFNVPEEAPTYTLTEEPFSKEYIDQISTGLGLRTNPIELQDSLTGRTLVFSEDNQYLHITPDMRIVDLKNQVILEEITDRTINNKDIEALSQKLILETFSELNKDLLKLRSIRQFYITDDGIEADYPSSNVTAVTYDFTLGDYRILSSTFEVGTATLMFNDKKQLVSLYVNEPSNIQRKGIVKIKTLDEIKNKSEELQLQSLDDGRIDITKISNNYVSSAVIRRVEMAYYDEILSKSNELEPILVLTGVANTISGIVEVVYTMPATN